MEYVKYNLTDLNVSRIGLGSASFGAATSSEKAFAIMDAFVAKGGNLIDTAVVYGEKDGEFCSERIIGNWLASRKCRSKIILCTKGGHSLDLNNLSALRMTPTELETDIQQSLAKLQTNYIDLYFFHRDDPAIPVETLIDWLESKKSSGQIRYYGCSNWSLERIKAAQDYAKSIGSDGFVCNQMVGGLAYMDAELARHVGMVLLNDQFIQYHEQTGLNYVAAMALGGGYFAAKLNGMQLSPMMTMIFDSPVNQQIFDYLKSVLKNDQNILEFCFQYILQQKFPTTVMVGTASITHLDEAIAACGAKVDLEFFAGIRQIIEERDR